ncbi:MAG TPA: hypothetical protein VG015_08135 [Candidatus Dormibacteraeota bacterium]|nr:hypothetical protein [Candidatus Dormibacteraeota bacterium]
MSAGRDQPPNDEEGIDAAASFDRLAESIERIPPLAPGEARGLVGRLAKDPTAVKRLFDSQLATVLKLARSRAGQGLELSDLFQDGSEGLTLAIHDYARSPLGDFEARAEVLIARYMDAALADEATARADEQQLMDDAEAYERTELSLASDLKRRPSLDEIASKLKWPVARAENIRDLVEEARRQHDQDLMQYLDPLDLVSGDGDVVNPN